jgi:hypothetical protein
MRSGLILTAGLTLASLASGAPEEQPSPPLEAVQEAATPGDHFTQLDRGYVSGTVRASTGYVLTLEAGQDTPLVQLVVKDEDALRIRENSSAPINLAALEEGTEVRAYFRAEGDVRVVTEIDVLESVLPAEKGPAR